MYCIRQPSNVTHILFPTCSSKSLFRGLDTPPAYTPHAQNTPLRYPNPSHTTTDYGTMQPSTKWQSSPSPGERIAVIVTYVFVGILIGYMVQTPIDSSYRKMERSEWAIDKQNHIDEQQKWLEWVSNRDAEQRRWDEELAQKRGQIEWQGLQRQRCIRYGTREYTATLSHVPLGLNPMDECRSKSLQINGRDLLPTRCEDQVSFPSSHTLENTEWMQLGILRQGHRPLGDRLQRTAVYALLL